MNITIKLNQLTDGGNIVRESWEIADAFDRPPYYTGETVKTVTVTLPDEWSVGETADGVKHVFDGDDHPVKFKQIGDYLYAIDSSGAQPRRLKRL